ncbi:MAG: hypothetical protein V1837_00710 [Candidatus Woesearchaeota archaeon]
MEPEDLLNFDTYTFDDLLFFPREKLRLRKVKSGNCEPKAWLIEERLAETGTKLDMATEDTGIGLASGFRSGIVRDREGNYIKLKGIAFGTITPEMSRRGWCGLDEAIDEHIKSLLLLAKGFMGLASTPYFIEESMHPYVKADIWDFVRKFNKPKKYGESSALITPLNKTEFTNALLAYSSLFKVNIGRAKNGTTFQFFRMRTEDADTVFVPQRYSNYKQIPKSEDDCVRSRIHHLGGKSSYVPAFKIDSDTRLDELIYHFTRYELGKESRLYRDSLFHALAYELGNVKARLTAAGFSWGHDLEETNNHIGNAVVDIDRGIVYTKITDVADVQQNPGKMADSSFGLKFKSRKEFIEFTDQEIETLASDFLEPQTFSLANPQKYKYFPDQLREECADIVKVSYYLTLKEYQRLLGEIWPINVPKSRSVPENIKIPSTVFLQSCKVWILGDEEFFRST